MALSLEALEASVAQASNGTPGHRGSRCPSKEPPTRRKHLPEHFERIDNTDRTHASVPARTAAARWDVLGTDTAEVLEVKTVTFTVTRHIRPKKRCSSCSIIVQAPAPLAPDREEFCWCLFISVNFKLEVRLSSAVVSAVPDLRACRLDLEPHDADAVGRGE